MNVALVGLVSSYREGRLVQGAVRSLLDAVDHVYVFEGPAGEPLAGDVPDTDLGGLADDDRLTVRVGRWRTDARKRTAIVEQVKDAHRRDHRGRLPPPLWGLWLDGDELLFNGEYVRDWLQVLQWHDELHPEQQPHLGKPLRMIELDGSVVWTRARLQRIDLLQRYEVSTATFLNQHGIVQGGGNFPDVFSEWALPRSPYFEADRMLQHPPITGEPHVLHRSALRHPLRAANRMHKQEAVELERRKEPA